MGAVTIVSDTGPIVALAKVDHLNLLHTLFGTLLVTEQVRNELLAKRSTESTRIEKALTQFIEVKTLVRPLSASVAATQHLDQREASVIQLAYSEKLSLLIDEKLGRTAATQILVPIVGTMGVLIQAKRKGLISSVMPVLYEVRRKGYWLSDQMLSMAAKLANETDTSHST